jgi:hypothetical protein
MHAHGIRFGGRCCLCFLRLPRLVHERRVSAQLFLAVRIITELSARTAPPRGRAGRRCAATQIECKPKHHRHGAGRNARTCATTRARLRPIIANYCLLFADPFPDLHSAVLLEAIRPAGMHDVRCCTITCCRHATHQEGTAMCQPSIPCDPATSLAQRPHQ